MIEHLSTLVKNVISKEGVNNSKNLFIQDVKNHQSVKCKHEKKNLKTIVNQKNLGQLHCH